MVSSPEIRLVLVLFRLALVAALGLGPAFPAGAAPQIEPDSIPNQHVPQAATLAPDVPAITATKSDALVNDVDGDTLPDPGDTLRYTVVVTNSGSTDALGLVLSDTLDANTTLSGTVQASPLAITDLYTATEDTPLVIAAGAGVLANDFGLPAPSAAPRPRRPPPRAARRRSTPTAASLTTRRPATPAPTASATALPTAAAVIASR